MNFFWGTTKLFRNIMFLHQVAKRKTNGDTIFQKFYVPMSRFGREVEVRANDGTSKAFLRSKNTPTQNLFSFIAVPIKFKA